MTVLKKPCRSSLGTDEMQIITLTCMYICSDGQALEYLKELLSKLFTKTNHKLHFSQNSQSCYTFPFIKEKLLVTGVLVLLD